MCIALHCRDVRLATEILAVADVDVAGSPKGRQPETDRADPQFPPTGEWTVPSARIR
jgi:hypothetical protein